MSPLSKDELVRRAAELVPMIQKNATWAEENRRLPDETIEALADSGILNMRVPARYGGFESDNRTVVEVLAELARGDGATSWTVAVWTINAWVAGLFPDEVQDEIFAEPQVRVSGILGPTAVAVPADGGVVLNGRWAFNSGCLHSMWNTNAALLATPEGTHEPVLVAVPLSDLEVVDDWYTVGMRGSGSVSTVAKDVFVPRLRVLPVGPALAGLPPPNANAGSPVFRQPFMPTACTAALAPALGLARAAQEAFFERLPGRKITYTSYANQAEAPVTHLQVAEAAVRADEAEFHAYRAAGLVDAKAAGGDPWTVEERARVRLDAGAVCQRAREAVDILSTASGASSVYQTVPIQRIQRDVQTLNLHAILHPNTNLELYGRVLCGLPPHSLYI